MRILYSKRGTGKTREAISIASKTSSHIVCEGKKRASEVFSMAKEMGMDIPFPLTYDEFVEGRFYGMSVKSFVIEDVDLLIQRFARGIPVKLITITREGEDHE